LGFHVLLIHDRQCYQTSDVTITNPKVRRVTLLHAIYSFFFVATILGLVINILSNII
jgi:uncharacterized membrane protein